MEIIIKTHLHLKNCYYNINIITMEINKTFNSKETDYVQNYNKSYYEKTKEARLATMKVKVTCETCGCIVSKGKLSGHNKSKKHLNFLQILESVKGLKNEEDDIVR